MQTQTRFYYRPTYATHELECYLSLARYSCNDRTCIQLYSYDEDYDQFIPYATLTVNIPNAKLSAKNCVFIDINNCQFVERLLIDTLHVAKRTNHFATSGFCVYPEVELNIDKLTDYIYFTEV